MNELFHPECPKCEAGVGSLHQRGCDVERCPYCGGQMLLCLEGCDNHNLDCIPDDDRMPWDGYWPGELECVEFGWAAKLTAKGWVPCDPDDPDAEPDLNRLRIEAIWDRERKRRVRVAQLQTPTAE